MRNLLVLLCTVLIWSPLTQANQGKIVFKSEVAGSDLPFSDAVLTGNTLYISAKAASYRALERYPMTPKRKPDC